jgi:hypothetical protein
VAEPADGGEESGNRVPDGLAPDHRSAVAEAETRVVGEAGDQAVHVHRIDRAQEGRTGVGFPTRPCVTGRGSRLSAARRGAPEGLGSPAHVAARWTGFRRIDARFRKDYQDVSPIT